MCSGGRYQRSSLCTDKCAGKQLRQIEGHYALGAYRWSRFISGISHEIREPEFTITFRQDLSERERMDQARDCCRWSNRLERDGGLRHDTTSSGGQYDDGCKFSEQGQMISQRRHLRTGLGSA